MFSSFLKAKTHSLWRVGQELDIALSYSAGSPDCRLDVVVHVPVVVKHMDWAKLWVQACMKVDYSPEKSQSQE
jgi:hypothetical protein